MVSICSSGTESCLGKTLSAKRTMADELADEYITDARTPRLLAQDMRLGLQPAKH
jgi:hypothetical protein